MSLVHDPLVIQHSNRRSVHFVRNPNRPPALESQELCEGGPFHLGKLSYLVAIVAVLWICLISIAFVLPQATPVNVQTPNYAVVAVGVVVLYSVTFWLVSAGKWFKGPIKQIESKARS